MCMSVKELSHVTCQSGWGTERVHTDKLIHTTVCVVKTVGRHLYTCIHTQRTPACMCVELLLQSFFPFPHSWVSWPLSTAVHCRSGCIYHCTRTWASRYHIKWWSEDNQAGSECNTANTAPSCMLEEDMWSNSLDECLWHHRYGEGQPKDEVVWRAHEDGMGERCVHR